MGGKGNQKSRKKGRWCASGPPRKGKRGVKRTLLFLSKIARLGGGPRHPVNQAKHRGHKGIPREKLMLCSIESCCEKKGF